jgi:CDGSH-type Zn-finger protein
MSDIGRIDVLDDGPLVAEGLDKLDNSKGDDLEVRKKVALCRCGASENKPFCDGSHKKIGFSNRVEIGVHQAPSGIKCANGIKVLRNGPYEIRGCLLGIADPMNSSPDEPYYLCRCGASGNKPFCDGSHKVINFYDEKN